MLQWREHFNHLLLFAICFLARLGARVNFTAADGISSTRKSTGMAASFHMAKLGTAEGCKVFAPTLGALHSDRAGLGPQLPSGGRL